MNGGLFSAFLVASCSVSFNLTVLRLKSFLTVSFSLFFTALVFDCK